MMRSLTETHTTRTLRTGSGWVAHCSCGAVLTAPGVGSFASAADANREVDLHRAGLPGYSLWPRVDADGAVSVGGWPVGRVDPTGPGWVARRADGGAGGLGLTQSDAVAVMVVAWDRDRWFGRLR